MDQSAAHLHCWGIIVEDLAHDLETMMNADPDKYERLPDGRYIVKDT